MKEEEFDQLIQIVKEAAKLFGDSAAAGHIKVKGKADFVTEVDTAVQEKISGELKKLWPEIQFMGEEKDNSAIDYNKPVWILDPVDGTTNLIHHFRGSCISLALAENGQVTEGIVYNPYSDELFTARKGQGAYLNGKPIHVSSAKTLEDSLISIGTNPYNKKEADQLFEGIKEIFLRSQDIRRIGSAAIDLCYVACARTEAFLEPSLKPWDFAAGKLIVEEAGGFVTRYDDQPLTVDGAQSVLATNGSIHEEIRKILQRNG